MNWYVHYTIKDEAGEHKCVEGPYSEDQALDRRRELRFHDAYLSEEQDESPTQQTS